MIFRSLETNGICKQIHFQIFTDSSEEESSSDESKDEKKRRNCNKRQCG